MQTEIKMRNNGTISAFGQSQSRGAENFLIIPCIIITFPEDCAIF